MEGPVAQAPDQSSNSEYDSDGEENISDAAHVPTVRS
jgi:hypothetical protein